jgi:Protein kinase domain
MVQLTCPDASRWEALLADSAALDEATELEAHLSSCSRCRTVLDDVAVGSSGWLRDAGRLATSADRDPALTRTLHRLHDSAVEDDHTVPPIPLDFLSPSEQPGILGTLGRYQVLAVLGRGAFGIVLKALDPDLLRPVAIKVLAPYLASSGTARQRFLREARAAAAVSHDHVVKIHNIEPAALPYLVMEYVTGVSLQARLDRDGPLPPRDIARIGMQAARGLEAAHAQGMVHRDIKPANILLENGVERVKLTDFGLARAADDARLTQSGVAAGTPLYMSPEQARGESLDHRSDLFSLGSVLYALATGFPPFRAGSTMGVLNRITNDAPRPIRETIPDFPADLENIIMQLLEKDRSKRFQMAADVSFRLTAFLAGPNREPPTETEGTEEPEKKSPWVVALCLLAAAAMVAIVLTFRTSKGTLVVEVDDPEIKVALDGEELTITGAGPQEVRLKPGAYHVTATKDGKPAKVSQEIVKIEKGGKQVVKVTVELSNLPAPDPYAGKRAETAAPDVDNLLNERLKSLFPDGPSERLELMRQAWREKKANVVAVRRANDGPVVQTHQSYPDLQNRMAAAAEAISDPDRLRAFLREAHDLAGLIREETDRAYTSVWQLKFAELQDRIRSPQFPDTPAGRAVALAPFPSDPDSATADLSEPDRGRARKYLSALNEFFQILPKAQTATVELARAKQELAAKLQEQRSGTASEKEVAAAQEKVNKVERDLKARYDALNVLVSDLGNAAVELGAKPASAGNKSAGSTTVLPDKRNEVPEERQRKLVNEFQTLVGRLVKTEAGRVLLTTGPGGDLDKMIGDLSADETIRAKRLLVLRDQFGVLAPKAQKELDRWENAGLAFADREAKYKAGLISQNEYDAAQLEVKQAERALKTVEDAMAGVIADVKKLADELHAPAADAPDTDPLEAPLKKVMAEFDALVLRLAKTEVGRLLATFPIDRTPAEAEFDDILGRNEKKVAQASRMLKLRGEIAAQERMARTSLNERNNRKESKQKAKKEDLIPNVDEEIRKNEHDVRVRTAAIRSLVDDFRKLADEMDPPPSPPDEAEAEFKKVMAEYDALCLRLVNTPIGRALALAEGDSIPEAQLKLLPEAGRETARRLLDLQTSVRKQRAEADKHRERLRPQPGRGPGLAGDASDLQGLKFRTQALRGLVDDMRKLADEIDPPDKKKVEPKKKADQ